MGFPCGSNRGIPGRGRPRGSCECAGELIIDRVLQPEAPDLAFNPAVLAPGIEPGHDDLFSDRAGAYAVAQASRLGHRSRQ